MGRGARRNDRAASIRRDDKHFGALGTRTPLATSNGNLSAMLKGGLRGEFRRVRFRILLPGSSKENKSERRGPMSEGVGAGGRRAIIIIISAMRRPMK